MTEKELKKVKAYFDNAFKISKETNAFVTSKHVCKTEAGIVFLLLWDNFIKNNSELIDPVVEIMSLGLAVQMEGKK